MGTKMAPSTSTVSTTVPATAILWRRNWFQYMLRIDRSLVEDGDCNCSWLT